MCVCLSLMCSCFIAARSLRAKEMSALVDAASFQASINVHNTMNPMTEWRFSLPLGLLKVCLLLHRLRCRVQEAETHAPYFDVGNLCRNKKKCKIQTECLKCFQFFWNIRQTKSSVGNWTKKMWRRKPALLFQIPHWLFLMWLCIFYSIYWFTHRLLGNLMPVREELKSSSYPVMSILPLVLFDPRTAAPDLF